ncbi:site-specific DNA-methyltransferase [Limosilactobacillus fermentum]|uniref:site-specific DNA-methyltransferase n=1 Tax=Limosilactobacillus fermentum TaxID=1613 RepID=UPI002F269D4D
MTNERTNERLEEVSSHSLDITEQNIEKLKELFPEVLTEKKIDFDKLRLILGDEVETAPERYSFTWNGKKQAMQLAQQPTVATLKPNKAKSKNWDETQNLYIEGDNLEVLKILQKSYANKVKLIYLDPPYNTGHDFVYQDNFHDTIKNYLEETGQVDSDGHKYSHNSETSGRFHTDWLDMIYPRLKLGRNLLTDDGLIFISISDDEVSNLLNVMDELFGETNHLATLIWDKNHSAQAGRFKVYHEYVVVYAKNVNEIGHANSENNELFEAGAMKKASGRHSLGEFTFPKGTRFDAPDGKEIVGKTDGVESIEVVSGILKAENGKTTEDVTIRAAYTQINQMQQYFYGDRDGLVDTKGQEIVEFYLNSAGKVKVVKRRSAESPQTTQRWGSQGPVSTKLAELFGVPDSPFDSPKPVGMMKTFIDWYTEDEDIIMDFFSGSGSTAESVMETTASGQLRKYILVSLPENLDDALKVAQKDAVKTLETAIDVLDKLGRPHVLTEIAEERIKLAGEKIAKGENVNEDTFDPGFKVFELSKSNIKKWNAKPKDLNEQFELLANNFEEGSKSIDVVYEIMLKQGLDLTYPIREIKVGDAVVYDIAFGAMFVVLGDKITSEVAGHIMKQIADEEAENSVVVLQDEKFINDSEKLNTIEQLNASGIQYNDILSI